LPNKLLDQSDCTRLDVLLGGADVDKLVGGSGDDLLIAGPTAFDTDLSALMDIFDEWTSGSSYADRIAHLTGTAGGVNGTAGGVNGTTVLSAVTVDDDLVKDVLKGAKGKDWFVVSDLDTLDLQGVEKELVV
jgi:hypothetical protein